MAFVPISGLHGDNMDVASDSKIDPARPATDFEAKVFIVNLRGKIKMDTSAVLDIHNEHVECVFTQLIKKFDRTSKE